MNRFREILIQRLFFADFKVKISNEVNPLERVPVYGVAAIAQWIRRHPLYCGPGFESQAQHLCFFQFLIELSREKDETKQKRGRDRSIF